MNNMLLDEMNEVRNFYTASYKAGEVAHGTLTVLEQAFSKLAPYWGNRKPEEITKLEWEKYLDWYDKMFPNQTVFNCKKYMNVLISHLIEKGTISKRPSIRDRHAKRDRELRKRKKSRVLSDYEIVLLEKACKNDCERLALKLGYQMGFRISDVCKLSWDRITLNAPVPYVCFIEGDDKAGLDAVCPISSEIEVLLRSLNPAGSQWLFPKKRNKTEHWKTQSLDAIWRGIKMRAGVQWATFHSLRHKCLTRDFKDKRFTPLQVSKIRRVSMKVAEEHYFHTETGDLALLRNSGEIKLQQNESGATI